MAADHARSTRFRVEGMDCASCASKIEAALNRVAGVSEVHVSVPAGTVTVIHRGEAEHLARPIASLGYQIVGQEF